MIILALEHPPEFIAASVVGSIVSNAVCAVFALSYAALAQRRSLVVSLRGALAVWLVLAALTRLLDWTAPRAVLLNAVVFPLAIFLGSRFRGAGASHRIRPCCARGGGDRLRARRHAASSSIGSYTSGLFAFFPVAMSSFFLTCIRVSAGRRRQASPRTC
jgi:hypothetical protein